MAQKQKRMYENSYPSVTECLGVLRKIGLEMWFKYNTAAFCDEKSKRGKEVGTQIHDAIQSFIETGSAKTETLYQDEVTNALKSFMAFRRDLPEISLHKSEIPLTSELHGFNGTIDCLSDNLLVDWKTGECKDKLFPPIYDEYKYQVAAYVYLYNEIHNTNIQKAIIVAIAKDKVAYSTYWMDAEEIKECFENVFLSCLKITNHQRNQKAREYALQSKSKE